MSRSSRPDASTPPFHIRAYRSIDIGAMIDVFRLSVRHLASRDYTPAQILAWAPDEIAPGPWSVRYAARQAWIAETSGQVVGFTDLLDDGLIDMLFVHPGHARRGVATALLARVEAAARDRGMTRLHTEASLIARPFFERHGFRVIAAQTVVKRGQSFRNFRMEKPLALPECPPAL